MSYKKPISEPVAVVGSGCRFAGGVTKPSRLWDLLVNPTDLTREIPTERFNIKAFYHPDGEYHGTTNSNKAYFLDQNHRVFDAAFFNIAPKEAEAIDPQQRMTLEVVYEALESAGYTLHQYAGAKVAVFAGLMTGDYDTLSQRDELDTSQYYATGNARSILSNRISYYFNFNGPSMTIDTACSSSLVALHQAILSLRSGECDMACVAGANLILTPEQFIVESNLHMLSPSGHCRMWDAGADGYARGEGVAAIFIKPLSKALQDGDDIKAVIRETGVNSDGRSRGITMPNWEAQSRLIQDTYRRAGLDPKTPTDRCQYFEAHGTGTSAGDPNEARAIEHAFFGGHDGPSAKPTEKLLVGSVKTVIGHTEGAAGLAGLLKVVESMRNDSVPPNLHFEKLNPDVEVYYGNLLVPTAATAWPAVSAGQPKRGSVNSFGFGGTNAHAIVEQYVPEIHNNVSKYFNSGLVDVPRHLDLVERPEHGPVGIPLLLSAPSQKSLLAVAKAYRDYFDKNPTSRVEAVAWHTYARRTAFPFRVSLSATSVAGLVDKLDSLIAKAEKSSVVAVGTRVQPGDVQPKILGVFTGQGAQWATMSRRLFLTSEVFANTIRSLDDILKTCPDPPSWSLAQEIMANPDKSRVKQAAVSQPLCTAVQLALVDLLRHLGIAFHAVVGHSSGEIAAAYAAGKIAIREAMLISHYRGLGVHMAHGADGAEGGMLAAGLSMTEAAELCARGEFANRLWVAASNSPSTVTLSGDLDAVQQACEHLTKEQKFARVLHVDKAYHSPHMEPASGKYLECLAKCNIVPSTEPTGTTWVSSVSGSGEPPVAELSATYWKDNMVKPVLFYEAVATALETFGPFDCAIEVGPHPALKGPVAQIMKEKGHAAVPYSGVLDRKMDDREAFADFLGWMWTHFGGSSSSQIRHFVLGSVQPQLANHRLLSDDLPLYPWDHSNEYYRESRISRQYHFKTDKPHELLGVRTRDDNKFQMRWRNILKYDKLPWVKHHSFQGQALLPASAYLVMALDAARAALAGRKASVVELRDLKFPSGIILEPDAPGLEVLFSLTIEKDDQATLEASFTLASVTADGRTGMKKNFSGSLTVTIEEPHADAFPLRATERAETLHASPDAFYDMMAGTGLVYTCPFKGLQTLERRFNYSSGTLKKYHDEDTTGLAISPATLDSCLQTAFVTISSPGDNAIWTAFLPVHMDSVRFNLAICDIEDPANDSLVVDAYMTNATPTTAHKTASFTADIEIFSPKGEMEIQVLGLTVGSFSPTKPEDDYELYLTTKLDLDPDFEMPKVPDVLPRVKNPMLVESCERVASFYTDLPGANPWPNETPETVEKFVHASPYFVPLDFICQLGQNTPDVLRRWFGLIIEEAHRLNQFHNYVAQVVRQIAHKYSRMNVLVLSDPGMGITEHVLAGLDRSFQSFRLGSEPEKNLESRIRLSDSMRKRVMVDKLDLYAAEPEKGLPAYDLVLLSTSLIDGQDTSAALKTVKGMMRPGGFLLLVDVTVDRLKDRFERFAGLAPNPTPEPASPPDWPDVLDQCGFSDSIGNSTQFYPAGFSLIVRHAHSPEKKLLLEPFAPVPMDAPQLAKELLIIGGKTKWTELMIPQICEKLRPRCGHIAVLDALESVDLETASSISAVLHLGDMDEPTLAGMTEARMAVLRALLRPEMIFLWATVNALHKNPDNAASFGFTRTLAAETPGLALQVVDLGPIATTQAVAALTDTFARLALQVRLRVIDDDDGRVRKPLWVNEPEVHWEGCKRLVPRVLPWKDGNDSVNAPRRVVANMFNTLERVVRLEPAPAGQNSAVFEARLDSSYEAIAGDERMQVHYSLVHPAVSGHLHERMHCLSAVCLGRLPGSGRMAVAVARGPANVSYLTETPRWVSPVSKGLNQPALLGLVVRYLTALRHLRKAEQNRLEILVLEPDQMFLECVEHILAGRNIRYQVWSTDKKRVSGARGTAYQVRPTSAVRDLRARFPRNGEVTILDLSPLGSKVSGLVREAWEGRSRGYMSNAKYISHGSLMRDMDFPSGAPESEWIAAVKYATARAVTWMPADEARPISVPELLQTPADKVATFQIVDWRADRAVPKIVKPLTGDELLSPRKTYVLVGLTRDFGQSLCTLFVQMGARHMVLCSRSPPATVPRWTREMLDKGINVHFRPLDVTRLDQVQQLRKHLAEHCPPVGGVVNGAMVLDDRVFSQMSLSTFHRVMAPKATGSRNLDEVFDSRSMDFFIMTSSFAAIGGHAGQSNYAAANMYMNGLAADRRRRGLPGSVLNIGVIYGLGFLHREKDDLYTGLEREGYPPISERDLHHMFVAAIVAGRPPAPDGMRAAADWAHPPRQDLPRVYDITTGLRRFPADAPTLHWHSDPRFSHFCYHSHPDTSSAASSDAGHGSSSPAAPAIKDRLRAAATRAAVAAVLEEAVAARLRAQLQLAEGAVTREHAITELGVDSLAAVELRSWAWRALGQDVAVMKILGGITVGRLCEEIADGVMRAREGLKEDGMGI